MLASLFTAAKKTATIDQRLAEAKALSERGEYEAALAIWGPLAHEGVARAANNVGACFVGALGVERNLELGAQWLKVAADGGDPAGQRNYAAALFQGHGVPQDYQAAHDFYRKAAEAGDGEAQDMLSWMLLEGEVVAPDVEEARRWAQAAAAQNIPAALMRMGMIHHDAIGVERNTEEAAKYWARGVETGDADCMAMLGAANHLGQGVERDSMRAMVLLIMAKTGGSALASTFYNAVKNSLPDGVFEKAEKLAADITAKRSAPA